MLDRCCLPLAVSLWIAAAPGQEGATGEVVEKGRFFVLHCHGGDQELAARALAAIEPVWPRVAEAFGVGGATPKQPLDVHLYRQIADYEAADMRLTNGTFRRNLAMTHHASNSAHVALQPPCSDETLRALGLPGQTVALLAWEATHVARCELLRNHDDHPMWLVDGLGAIIGREVAAAWSSTAAGDLPIANTHVVLVQRLLEQKKLPPASAILADRIDDLDFHDRYAARAVFFEFLSTPGRAAKLAKVLGVVRSTGGGAKYRATVLDQAKKAFGTSLDRDFVAHVTGARPQWHEVLRSLMPVAGGWQQLAFPDTNAVAWHQVGVRGGVRIAGKLRILPGDGRQLNVLFGRTDDGDFFSVAFVAGYGCTVFSYRAKDDRWERIGNANAPALRVGIEAAFVVQAKGDALQVRLDDQHWDFTLPRKLPDTVSWGLGAQAATAGLWLGVTATAPERSR